MAAMRGPRLQAGSAPWIAEERSSALQIVQSEVEEFSFSARNEMEWLNEHMAGIFDENETNFADAFKTPGKLRGKTPRTIRKAFAPGDARVPLSNVFAATPNGVNPQLVNKLLSPKAIIRSPKFLAAAAKLAPQSQLTQDSGYYGSQDIEVAAAVFSDQGSSPQKTGGFQNMNIPTKQSQSQALFADVSDKTFQTAKEEQTRQFTKQTVFSDAQSSPLRQNLAKIAQASSPLKQSPLKSPVPHSDPTDIGDDNDESDSPSEASSPIRQVMRKSSLNFASLPAREPLAAGKNTGRVSRVSHLEKASVGKSLGHGMEDVGPEVDCQSDMDVDVDAEEEPVQATDAKTYTQRLQDQINQLGKPNGGALGQARLYPNIPSAKQNALPTSQSNSNVIASPTRKQSISKVLQTTPGAFPEEEDDDDWIEPPSAVPPSEIRPAFPKSYTADVMEGIQGKETISQPEFPVAKPEYATRLQTHGKSASVTTLPSMQPDAKIDLLLTKSTSFSHALGTVAESQDTDTPFGSPSRLFRDSPLKQMKSKLSSILKGSRSLLASSAAISAEGKSSLLSPSTAQLGMHASPSTASLVLKNRIASDVSHTTESSLSPAKTRRTRASAERQREDKRREKEAKHIAEQMDRLDKAREKEREKARVFSKEQERIAAMEREIAAKKQEEQMHAKQTPKARDNPRKANSDDDEQKTALQDVDMLEVPQIAPPSAVRTTSTTHSLRNRDVKRPVKPSKEDLTTKQAPTVIRVKPGSQHSQFHQTGRQSTNPQDPVSLPNSQHQLNVKASKASLHSKASSQSLKSSTNGRPKAAETAARKKEAEEREAQKRRDAKAEAERKRAASQEEQRRQEQLRRADADRQKKEKELAEERKTVQRQAALEKAKLTKAPPPAARSQPNGPPDFTTSQQQKMESQGNRPPSRMMAGAQRQQAGANLNKAGTKRPVGHESNEDAQDRRPPTRVGPSYQGKDAKRRRTSEVLQDDAESGGQAGKGHAVRPSPGFKKDVPPKSLFQNGYSNAPPAGAHDLFKASVTSHQLQGKAARPVDMAQISKGNIPFAPNAAGPAFKTPARPGPYLAAKSAAKSVPRSSPQFQNGEAIDLPEIQTDDEDEEDDAGMSNIAGWAASPDLRAALMRQETMDPSQIFGPPAALNMEEVFSKSKDRWPKFRARTSSANWSGPDGLTEDDIRKDMAAREKLRREGGWSYEMSKDVL
ncbi:inner centromere [Cordyceps militaris]|uniref:Inner centromere n=1 Tax=Cordyceps militaris TaxID=73501 RepID=A0A2H4S803_CORMI|nr:inner centromere [Cordyceps militaris]